MTGFKLALTSLEIKEKELLTLLSIMFQSYDLDQINQVVKNLHLQGKVDETTLKAVLSLDCRLS